MLKKAIVFIVVLVFITGGVVVSKEGHNIWNFIQEHNPFIASIVTIEQELTEDGPPYVEVGQEIEPIEPVELTEDGPPEAELIRRQQLIEIKQTLDVMIKEVDALSKQVDELVVQKLAREEQEEKENEQENFEDADAEEDTEKDTEEQESNTFLANILISEVVVGLNGAKNEFIELYNPNDFDVILTNNNFKLKLVNSNNEITVKRIAELPKTISSKSYFLLIGGEIEGVIADASFASQLTRVSGVIITDGDDDIKDRVSWGKICDPEIKDCNRKLPPPEAVEGQSIVLDSGLKTGQSLGRILATTTEGYIYIDSDDNIKDFEIQTPTPGVKNQTLLDEDNEEKDEEEVKDEEIKEETENDKKIAHNPCADGKKININIASLEDLDFLTKIGPIRAQRIIDARPFNSLDELIDIQGIGTKTLENIKSQGCAFVETRIIRRGGGGGAAATPSPVPDPDPELQEPMFGIVINEIQLLPINKRFLELYNNTNYLVNLTGWYIQRKTKTGASWRSLITKTKFEGKVVEAKSYFLVSREALDNSDIILNNLTLTNDNSLVIRDLNGNIVDKIGFGDAQDYETITSTNPKGDESIGRAWDEDSENYIDTNNNQDDFEIQTPTPGAKNRTLPDKPEENGQDQSEDQPATGQPEDTPEQTPTLTVVINEIAWMGTDTHHTDEWIELYNNTTSTIDLTGWILEAKDGTPKIELTGEILPYGFFLLERKHNKEKPDDTVSDIFADQIYTGVLGNSGEILELKDTHNNLIDKVSCIKDEDGKCVSWMAGEKENRISMERINPKLSGTDINNWVDNNQATINGKDANGDNINGTPKAKNSVSN